MRDWLVRLHAVEALGKLKSPDAVDPLLRALFNERDSAIREDVVKALGTIRDVRAVDYLVVAMKEPGLRLLAVEALGHIGDRRVVPLLRRRGRGRAAWGAEGLATPCADGWTDEMATMGMAARALGMIADAVAIPSLIIALRNTITRSGSGGGIDEIWPDRDSFSLADIGQRAGRKRSIPRAGNTHGCRLASRASLEYYDVRKQCKTSESIDTLVSELTHEGMAAYAATAACLAGGPGQSTP